MPRLPFILSLLLVAAALAVSAWLYPELPDQIPTHWNIHGEADGFGPKAVAAWLLPAIGLGLVGFMGLVPWLSPKDRPLTSTWNPFGVLVVALTALFVYIHCLSLLAALRPNLAIDRALVAGVLLFLAALGGTFTGIERNFYIGIRVPWTIASQRVWDDTHRLAGRLWVAGGIAGALLAICGFTMAAFLLVIPMALVPIGYSFARYKQLERDGAL